MEVVHFYDDALALMVWKGEEEKFLGKKGEEKFLGKEGARRELLEEFVTHRLIGVLWRKLILG